MSAPADLRSDAAPSDRGGRRRPRRAGRAGSVFEWAVSVLLVVLTAVVAVRVAADQRRLWPLAVVLCVAVAGAHLAGVRARLARTRPARWWLLATAVLWAGLVAVDMSGVFVGFALFFVAVDVSAGAAGTAAVVGLLAVILVGEVAHDHRLTVAEVVGPLIGAAVAVAMARGYRSLEAENEGRLRLIDELEAAHAELASAEHARGVAQERERLAREIHDTLAQGLSSIIVLLRAAEADLDRDPAASRGHVVQAREVAAHDLEEARRFVRRLSPPGLADRSLHDALARLCASTAERSGVDVSFVTEGAPRRLPTDVEVTLLRIAQSALSNVVAHAQARRARVTLTDLPGGTALDVADDGRGFDPAARSAAGFGLRSMQARVEELGGAFSVESSPGTGTVVAAQLPVDGDRVG